jgi:hypothetical protein
VATSIQLMCGGQVYRGALDDSETAGAIAAALPIEGRVQRWGREIYFPVEVAVETAADAREVLAIGELAYWPAGPALCVFFGPTPASDRGEPRAASLVNPIGRIDADPDALDAIMAGTPIRIETV